MQVSFFLLLPSILLSGFMFPFRGMPMWAQWLGELLPATHFMRIVRGVMLKGADFGDIEAELGGARGDADRGHDPGDQPLPHHPRHARNRRLDRRPAVGQARCPMTAPAVDAPDWLSRLIPSRVARGFFLAVVSGLFFNFLNGAVKELASEMPPLYVAWGRWVAGIALIAPYLLWRVGSAGMRTRDMKLHCLRGLFHTPGYGLWYEAVVWLPLATMAALGFTGPIFVTLGAVLFLRETVHWRRWAGSPWASPACW